MDDKCKCGRIWRLVDHKLPFRDPGAIICKCGETIKRWDGSRTWTAELVKGLPEDKGKPLPSTYE